MGEIRSERADRWDWMRLHLGKANAVGPEFLAALDKEIDRLSAVDAGGPARPVLLVGQGSAFSAGLDLRTLIGFDRARMASFVRDFHGVFLRLACLPRPTIAVVNGHAVAGGAVLAVACDYRIGVQTIPGSNTVPLLGFNEVAVGLPFPLAAAAIIEHGMGGPGLAGDLMMSGRMLEPAGALQRGLLHEVSEPEGLVQAAEAAADRFANASGAAFAAVKAGLKRDLVPLAAQHADDSVFLDAWFSPEAQGRLKHVAARLGGDRP
ncbi:MAG: enoyl-CoA hydratase/isomerase family protein [Planctomycetota bacterium]